uniref:(northern house mosquito) hypothetical protein n=1 Tax=Culex pipiens TaxID=7175 RepID=A0A8D8C8L8_CULPI
MTFHCFGFLFFVIVVQRGAVTLSPLCYTSGINLSTCYNSARANLRIKRPTARERARSRAHLSAPQITFVIVLTRRHLHAVASPCAQAVRKVARASFDAAMLPAAITVRA